MEKYSNEEPKLPGKMDKEKFGKLREQVKGEWEVANDYMAPKLATWLKRLKLYNNQKRQTDAVGDPLLFTVTQTLAASLYDDQMNVEFLWREPGDELVAENLNMLAKFDYSEMSMDQLQYYWMWDTVFFGNGYVRMQEFSREMKRPVPELLDPLTLLRDPDAQSMNGEIKGLRPARYLGRLLELSKYELDKLGGMMNVDLVRDDKRLATDVLEDAKRERDEAQGRQTQVGREGKNGMGDNQSFEVVEWYTHFDGKLVQTLWANSFDLLIQYKVVDGGEIPIIKRALFPMAHDWDGTNVADLVEDKQRARSEIINLSRKAQKADLYPMYVYAEKRIRNRADLNFDFNKFIPAAGVGSLSEVIQPMNKPQPNIRLIDYMLSTLDKGAQQATATPDIQQGMMPGDKRTLGELTMVTNRADARFSLSAKIMGWSEKLFWLAWYGLYKKHFKKDIDAKIVRIVGAYGVKLRPLTRENIIMKTDPDVSIESKKLLEAKRLRDLLSFEKFLAFLKGIPESNMRFALREHGKMVGLEHDVINRMIPQTADELQATKENEMLNEGKLVQVAPTDDDAAHLDIHRYANDSKAVAAHILTHKDNMRLKVLKPELFPHLQQQMMGGNGQPILEGGTGGKLPANGSGLNPTNESRQDNGMVNNIFAQNNNAQQNIPLGSR